MCWVCGVSAGANFMTAAPSPRAALVEPRAQTAAAECGRTSHALCSLSRAQSNPACIINCKLREVKSLMCVCAPREWKREPGQARNRFCLKWQSVWVSVSARGLFMARFWVHDRARGELSKQPDGEKVVVRIRSPRAQAAATKWICSGFALCFVSQFAFSQK